jgi:8-oxo-dGTP pyrophosphatase MutT (NUDIX family)
MLNQDKSALPPSSCITIGDVMTYWDHTQAAAPFLFAPENNAVLTYGQLAIEARHLLAWFDEQGISKRGHVCIVQGRSTYKWSFPKGHCKDRETPFQCASRETREETGIQIPWQTHRPVKLSVGSYYVIFVETQFPSIVFDANEIVQVDWVSIEKLRVLRVNIDINSFLKKISLKSTDTVWSLIQRICSGYGFTQRCQPCFQEEQCVV